VDYAEKVRSQFLSLRQIGRRILPRLAQRLSGTNLIIDGALTEAARREQRKVRCRVTRRLAPATVHTISVAGSLIASRSQFAHAAYKTPHFEIFEWFFSQCVIWNKFVLDRIALSGEPSNQALGKDAPNGATQFCKFF
jgi:hypothetical protein